MFSLFSQNKNSKVLEEEKIEKPMEISKRSPLLPLPESHLHYTRVKKSEIEKEILLKRRRDPNVSMENIETSYKKRLTSKKINIFSFL